MKDVEHVTGRMGEGEAMAPMEEAVNVAVASDELKGNATTVETNIGDDGVRPKAAVIETGPQEGSPEPWSGLLQFGGELLSALSTSDDEDAAAHPWTPCGPCWRNRKAT